MRKRGFAAITGFAGVVLVAATAAYAAPAQSPNPAPALFGGTNLNLGGLLMSGFAQDSPRDFSAIHFETTDSRNRAPSRNLFPMAGTLSPAFLSGENFWSSAQIAVMPGVSFGVSHLSLGLPARSETEVPALAQGLALRLDPSLRSTGFASANLNLNLTDWSQLGIIASHSSGNSALLGLTPSGLRATPADSSALGISARMGFGEGWVTTLAYAEGVSQLDLSQMSGANAVRSDTYGIGLARTGLFGNDALGIALSRPLQLYTANSAALTANNFALSSTQARESDVELGYVTSFLDGTLALQANAAYQVNAAGTRGQNALAAVARAKLNF